MSMASSAYHEKSIGKLSINQQFCWELNAWAKMCNCLMNCYKNLGPNRSIKDTKREEESAGGKWLLRKYSSDSFLLSCLLSLSLSLSLSSSLAQMLHLFVLIDLFIFITEITDLNRREVSLFWARYVYGWLL